MGGAALPTPAAALLLQLVLEHNSSGHSCVHVTAHPKLQSGNKCSKPLVGVPALRLLTFSLRLLPSFSWAV